MGIAVAWVGPVTAEKAGSATVPGAAVTFVTCKTGECGPAGAAIAIGGSLVAGLLSRAGAADGELVLGSFSAGHELAKAALMDAQDRARVRAVMLSDSTYTSWADSSKTSVVPPEGYVRFAIDAVGGDKLFVATASHQGPGQFPSSYDTLMSLKSEVERRTGRSFQRIDRLPGVAATPEEAWRLGNVWLAVFGPSYSHQQHLSDLAPQTWNGMLLPWLGGGLGGGSAAKFLAFTLSAVAGWLGARALMRSR